MKGILKGGCLCGAVRYTLKDGVRLAPYACHCTDCQTRTGSAFSEHMLVAEADLELSGDVNTGRATQPSGAQSKIVGCAVCMARIYAQNDTRPGFISIRCGTLDRSAEIVPAAHIWVRSKQPWIALPAGARQMDGQPRKTEDWAAFVGLV
ncbi:GFA family protein [Pacificimonas sp. WHA3]|uniref:GFA family protein n=1 Tax=Pacificimonas pallii TaxID=2827236 RepID=A0ABS6SAS3_9SPHN|nr:GFA family protein [Pacificimonas pallii]MBV7255504.1 GFA family protein [Pacificimonas pallii]